MRLIKLTDEHGYTSHNHKKTFWQVGTINELPPKDNPELCTGDVFHAYRSINLAFLLNPIHAAFKNPIPWEIEGDIAVKDWGKVGSFKQEVLAQLSVPEWVTSDKYLDVVVMFKVLCSEAILINFENIFPDVKRPREISELAKESLRGKKVSICKLSSAVDAVYRVASRADDSATYKAIKISFVLLADEAVKQIMEG